MAVTINDVAKNAGVSIATVSRVINGRGSVDDRLKTQVLDAIQTLGYVPNSNAKALKQDRSRLIGITASDLSVSFFPEVVKRVEKTFQQEGYATIISSTYDDPKNERNILEHMVSRRVDALLVNSTGQNEDMLEQIAASGTPVILYDRRTRGHTFPAVYVDKQKAVYQAMEHLYSLGHRCIALVTGSKELTSNYDRYMGVQGFVFDRNLTIHDCPAFFGVFSEEYGMEIMDEMMKMQNRPTAIVTGSISITAGIMRYCREHGLSIPDDIAIVSSGNFVYAGAVGMALTYMDDRIQGLSDGIIQLLRQTLQGETLSADDQIVLAPSLCVGTSTLGR